MKAMKATEYRDALAKIKKSQVGAAQWVDAGDRTGQRWAAEGPPGSMAMLLRLMVKLKMTAADVDALLAK